MTKASEHAEVVLRANPTWLFVGTLLPGGGGSLMVLSGNWVGWLGVGIAVVACALLVWVVLSPNSRLYLSADGFRFGTLRRTSAYRWSDVACFFPLRVGPQDRVCFTFSTRFEGETKLRQINQEFGGFDRFLPNDYGMKASELADLLESWRTKFVDRTV